MLSFILDLALYMCVVEERIPAGTAVTVDENAAAQEAAVVAILGVLFLGVIGFGLVLAASGFLSEEADAFITEKLYPFYTPYCGVFLACSALYGVAKTRGFGMKPKEEE